MIILGIDPGTIVTGYGLIQVVEGAYRPLDFGAIRPPVCKEEPERRYLAIFEGIEELIKRFCPQALAVETQYVHKNIQSAIKLGMARGVAMVAAAKSGVPVFHYAPTKAKLAVVGKGHASKYEVQVRVRLVLGLSDIPQPADAADALALAICHANALTRGHRCTNLLEGNLSKRPAKRPSSMCKE